MFDLLMMFIIIKYRELTLDGYILAIYINILNKQTTLSMLSVCSKSIYTPMKFYL